MKTKAVKAVKPAKAVKAPKVVSEDSKRITVSEANLRSASLRLLRQTLVSSEMHYVQRVLGHSATQRAIDDSILAVRKLPWSSIVIAD